MCGVLPDRCEGQHHLWMPLHTERYPRRVRHEGIKHRGSENAERPYFCVMEDVIGFLKRPWPLLPKERSNPFEDQGCRAVRRERQRVSPQEPETRSKYSNKIDMGYPKKVTQTGIQGWACSPAPPWESGPRDIRVCCIDLIPEFSDFQQTLYDLGEVWCHRSPLSCCVRSWFIWLEQEKLPQKDETSFGELGKACFGLDVPQGIPTCGKNLICYL